MPRMTGRTDAPAAPEPNSLVASAVMLPGTLAKIHSNRKQWQKDAWYHYDICGELRYASTYVGNILSRATLHAAKVEPDGPKAITVGRAADALNALFVGANGQEQMLKSLGIHLTVAGEAFLVGRGKFEGEDDFNPQASDEMWEIVGTEEMRRLGNVWAIDYGDNVPHGLSVDDVVIRIWNPHPRKRMEADSPVRALLPILTEIEYLTRHVFAQVQSRLAGAGIIFIPQGAQFPPVDGHPATGNSAADFMQVFGSSMMKAISDPSSPSALVPIVVSLPDDVVDKVNYQTFWSPLDQHAVELRTEAIRRLALGLEVPPEVLLGTSDSNHWSGWLVEESTIKAHIEPMLGLITNALTTGYLRPAGGAVDEIIAYDTAKMRLRPNRSREAIELYDRGELDGEALRRETGFDEDDKPDNVEFRDWLLKKMAGGSTTPEQVEAAAGQLGVTLHSGVQNTMPRDARPDPTLLDHPSTDPPAPASLRSDSMLAACDVLAWRALERAGNRLKGKTQIRPPGVSATDLYRYLDVKPAECDLLLDDAWGKAESFLNRYDVDVPAVVAGLDAYTRSLLITKKPHEYVTMQQFVEASLAS